MKKFFVFLFFISSSVFAEDPIFRICEKKESKCESKKVEALVFEYEEKVVTDCTEVSYWFDRKSEHGREVAYYECKIAIETEGKRGYIKIKIRPARPHVDVLFVDGMPEKTKPKKP